MKGDAKCKGKLTRGLKNDIRNLLYFSCEQLEVLNYVLQWSPFVQSI